MKSIRVIQPGKIELSQIAEPLIQNNSEVKVRVKAVGICGSDMHILHGSNPFATYPRTIGHEIVGIVEEIGDDVQNVKVGDRVAVEPIITCGECYACSIGKQNVCQSLEVMGVHRDGGMQEYLVVPSSRVHPFSSRLSFQTASLIEPFTIAAQATEHAKIKPNDFVYVVGAGPIGQMIAQVAKLRGGRVIVSDIIDSRLELVKRCGADYTINVRRQSEREELERITGTQGVNVIIDAAAIPQMLHKFTEILSPAGRLVLLGFSEEDCTVQQLNIVKKELEINGSRLQTNQFKQVIEWMEQGLLETSLLISHEFPFESVHEAIRVVESPEIDSVKVLLTF